MTTFDKVKTYCQKFCARTSRILCFGLTFAALALTSQLSMAQSSTQQIRIDFDGAPLSQVLKSIEKQSSYTFFYNNEINVSQPVTVHLTGDDINAIVADVLHGTGIAYRITDKRVVLYKGGGNSDDQERTVTGKIVDAAGLPLIGVTVLVPGTNFATVTDLNGDYSVRVPGSSAKISYSYVGYQTQEIAVGTQTTINLTMQESTAEIGAVVVTALGIKRSEKALSYNVQQVNSEDIIGNKDANFINSLNGKVAGVTINASSSGVGGASKVVMRGSKAISQSSNALYVIDGIPMFNLGNEGGTEFDSRGTTEAIADINPEDIESISVLTGAAAAALYGNNAANGAIVITTKKGKAGSLSVTLSQNTEFLRPFRMPEFQNRYGTGSANATSVDKSWGARLNSATQYGYDPAQDFLQTGVVTTETVALSTGTEKNQTYLSASAVNSQGMVPNNDYDRYNFTFRNTTSFLKDRMTLDVGASYIKQSDMNMVNQGTYSNPLVTAYLFPRGND